MPLTRCAIIMLVATAILYGCNAQPLPTYEFRDAETTLRIIQERIAGIQTYVSQGTLFLERAGSDPVVFDVIAIGRAQDDLRLRASKFNRTVFDLTVTASGRWLWVSERIEGRSSGHFLPLDDAWRALSPLWWAGGALTGAVIMTDGEVDDARILVDAPFPDQPQATLQAEIDTSTATVRSYRVIDGSGTVRQRIVIHEYGVFNGVPLPTNVTATGDEGLMRLRLNEYELNQPLAPGAFKPMAGAIPIDERRPDASPIGGG